MVICEYKLSKLFLNSKHQKLGLKQQVKEVELISNKTFGYARVSTTDQNINRQIDALQDYGVLESDIFIDKKSGKNVNRPAFMELQRVLRAGDTVIVESLSRLSRSTSDLLNIVNDWKTKDISLYSLKENLDLTDSATGQLLLSIFSAISQLERDLTIERVNEGLVAARARGRIGGRPKTDPKKLDKAIKLYNTQSHSIKEICDITSVSSSTLYRELKSRNQKSEEKPKKI